MITINDRANCCGCEACVQICPKNCVSLIADNVEGFLYPEVNLDICVNCGLCEKACPMSNDVKKNKDSLKEENAFAFIHSDDEIRMHSSSGGFFSAIANQILDDGGIVFGVRYDNHWMPIYDYIEEKSQIERFRGSKYVQARVGSAFKDTERFLKEGRTVLFTGTSCQIKALNLFLKIKYLNLYTVDFICHGIPSPAVWKQYLKVIQENARIGKNANLQSLNSSCSGCEVFNGERDLKIKKVWFRDKKCGWKKYSFALTLDKVTEECVINSVPSLQTSNSLGLNQYHKDNPYMIAFLNNLSIRPSCYNCKSKSGRSMSDITMADAWGINKSNPDMDDDKGTSLVIAHTEKGLSLIHSIQNCIIKEINLYDGLLLNPSYRKSAEYNKNRTTFFELYKSKDNWDTMMKNLAPSPTLSLLIKGRIKVIVKEILHKINII